MRNRGTTAGFRLTCHLPRTFVTITSGMTKRASPRPKRWPGFGSSERIIAIPDDGLVVASDLLLQLAELMGCEYWQMALDDLACTFPRRVPFGPCVELQDETFLQVARTDA